MLLPEHQCSSFLFTGEKKKRLRFTPISVRFGETDAASDFGSVCLAEAKSEVHTEAHPYARQMFLQKQSASRGFLT